MSTLTFAKTHNLIAYLAKSTESEGFEQIIDFLNVSSVSYALTASPTICTTCIKQFWTTKKVKTINNEVRIQALIDEKRLPSPSNDPLPGGEDSLKFKELMDLCTYLLNKVLELENEVIDIKSNYKERIKKLEGRVARLEEENRNLKDLHSVHSKVDTVTTAGATTTAKATKVSVPRRRRGVVIQDPEETTSTVVVHSEVQSKDKGKCRVIKEPKSIKGQEQIKQDEAFARQLEAELNADINWNAVMEQVKRSESEIRPLFEKHYSYNQTFLEEVNEEVTLLEKEVEVEAYKREGKSLEKEITKKQKMDEEAKELKSHLQIVTNDDDDVYTEATPLALKIPIVDYKIHYKRNKP
nr:hypothetical protein [Tanacetum cinerariifolium]